MKHVFSLHLNSFVLFADKGSDKPSTKQGLKGKPNMQLTSVNADTINIIDTYDRPARATAKSTYAQAGKYAEGPNDKPGQRIPKAGVYAVAGVERARALF